MISKEAVATHIRSIRRGRNVSQAQIAKELGLARSVVSRSDRGDRAWRFHEVLALADVLMTDLYVLVPEDE
ncbi:MAG: helix-turn-helix domain-containing protein [Nitrospiraceae bacterium]